MLKCSPCTVAIRWLILCYPSLSLKLVQDRRVKNADRLQKLTEECQNKSAAAAMDNAKADLGLIGQIVTGLSYTIKHQNISSATAVIFAYHRNGRHNLQTDEFADINFGQIGQIPGHMDGQISHIT